MQIKILDDLYDEWRKFFGDWHIAIFTFVIIFIVINVYIQFETDHLPKLHIDEICKNCRTGDLILFRWSFVDAGFRIFTKYCHVGIIYKDNQDQPFIIETHPEESIDELEERHVCDSKKKKKCSFVKSDTEGDVKEGVNMYPLKERLKDYDGTCYFTKLHSSIKVDNNKLQQNLESYQKIPFDTNFRNTFLQCWLYNKFSWEVPQKDDMYCSEFIGLVLRDLGILPKKYNIHTLSPSSFEDLRIDNRKLYDNIHMITF